MRVGHCYRIKIAALYSINKIDFKISPAFMQDLNYIRFQQCNSIYLSYIPSQYKADGQPFLRPKYETKITQT
jgi:hypothetical protein